MNKVYNNVTYIIMAIFLIGLFILKLMPALISGLVVFLIINQVNKKLNSHVKSVYAHNLTLLIVSALVVLLFTLIGIGVYSSTQLGKGGLGAVSEEALSILTQIRTYLPESWWQYIPDNVLELKTKGLGFMKLHVADMVSFTSHSLKTLVEVILGMFIGAVVAFSFLHTDKDGTEPKFNFKQYPFMDELLNRITIFSNIFAKVVGAQVKISAINATLTATYLMIVLPLCGIKMPYATTLVLCTFLFGLIPVLGNLMSNTLIVVISLLVSLKIAVASMVFLIVIHKLEYYINAKIVGSQIKTTIWELLIAMMIFQALFGVIGVVLAPVIYGYIKEELKFRQVIPN